MRKDLKIGMAIGALLLVVLVVYLAVPKSADTTDVAQDTAQVLEGQPAAEQQGEPASNEAASTFPDPRTCSPRLFSTSGGFHSANRRSPRGDRSSTTSSTGSPQIADARRPGSPTVAEPRTNVGFDP